MDVAARGVAIKTGVATIAMIRLMKLPIAKGFVMPGTRVRPLAGPSVNLVPGVHVLLASGKVVDGWNKSGHDEYERVGRE
jgi:hypothetical protein